MTYRRSSPRRILALWGLGTLLAALVLLGASEGRALESAALGTLAPPPAEAPRFPPWMEAIPQGMERALRTPEGLLTSRTTSGEILAETQTLEMEWHLVRNCRASFDESVALLRRYFLAPSGLLAWRLSPDARGGFPETTPPQTASDAPEGASASVDDLRACRVLLEAEARWQDPRYGALADHVLDALYAHCVQENLLLEGASWQRSPFFGFLRIHRSTTPVLLSYVDLAALALAAERQQIWRQVFSAMLGLSAAGALARDVPAGAFDPATERYDPSPINSINALLHLRTLTEVGLVPRQGVEALRREFLAQGTLRDPWGNENVAMYALAAEIFWLAGHPQEARRALDRIGNFRLQSPQNRGLVGYFQEDGNESAWIFDNLLALIAGARLHSVPELSGAPVPTIFP